MQELLPELYSLMLRHRFNPKKDKRNILVDAVQAGNAAKLVSPKKSETIGVFYDNLGFISRELAKTAKVTQIEEGAYLKANTQALPVEGAPGKFSKVLVVMHPGIPKKRSWKFFLKAEKEAFFMLPEELHLEATAEPVFLDYSPLSVMFSALGKKVEELAIKQDSFHPKPPAKKTLVKYKVLKPLVAGREEEFFEFLEKIFKFKNKDLSTALKHALPGYAGKIEKALNELKLEGVKIFQAEVEELEELFLELFPGKPDN